MKIVRIIARLNVGGPARHVVWLESGLKAAGHDSLLVTGVVPPGEDDMSYFAAENGVEPVVIPQMSREISPKDALTVWKLYRLYLRERPDLVHTHTAKAGTVGRVSGMLYRWLTPGTLVGRPRRCRFVHTYHGHIFHSYYGKWKTRLFLAIEKALAGLATDRIVVISPRQHEEIHKEFGVGRARQFRVIPLGLDTGAFAEWSRRRAPARAELRAGERDLLIGIVGRLTEVKNHSLFLKAAALYKKRFGAAREEGLGRVRFLVIGDGHLRAGLESEARSLGLDADVTFTGTRGDPEDFYPALDIVALTSLNEGTPLTLIEAMANARPVIATKVGGVVDLLGASDSTALDVSSSEGPDDFQVYEHGVGVRPGDPVAFSKGLAYMVASEDIRRAMGERGLRFVEQNYSRERLVADVLKLYGELAEEKQLTESKAQSPKSKVEKESSTLDTGL